MLTIHQLHVFVTVADHRSMRAAAEELTVSQPAVSASIAALQREVGVDLFVKQGRGIELTPSGRTMLGYARRLLDLLDEGLQATRSNGGSALPAVRLGVTSSAAAHLVTPWLTTLRQSEAGLDFILEVANRSRIWRMLAERQVDVALTSRPPTTAAFDVLATRTNELVLVGRPGLVWSGRLGDATWLIRENGSTARAATEEIMARLDISPPHLVIGADAAVLSSAQAGLGLALLPAAAVDEAVRARSLITVRTEATPMSVPWHLIVRSDESVPRSVGRFVARLAGIDDQLRLTPAGSDLLSGQPAEGAGRA